MELTGRIIAVLETKSGTSSKTGNPWMMQGYVIEVPGQYPRRCAHHYEALAHYFTATLLIDHQRKAGRPGAPGFGQGCRLAASG